MRNASNENVLPTNGQMSDCDKKRRMLLAPIEKMASATTLLSSRDEDRSPIARTSSGIKRLQKVNSSRRFGSNDGDASSDGKFRSFHRTTTEVFNKINSWAGDPEEKPENQDPSITLLNAGSYKITQRYESTMDDGEATQKYADNSVDETATEDEVFDEVEVENFAAPVQSDTMPLQSHMKGFSLLECIVEILKGARVTRKIAVVNTSRWVYIGKDLGTLKWKQNGLAKETFLLKTVRALRLNGSRITLDCINSKAPLSFKMASVNEALIWFSALQCLVPSTTALHFNDVRLKGNYDYNIFEDTYAGTVLNKSETWNQYHIVTDIPTNDDKPTRLCFSILKRRFYTAITIGPSHDGVYAYNNQLMKEKAILLNLSHINLLQHKEMIYDKTTSTMLVVMEHATGGPILDPKQRNVMLLFSEEKVRSIIGEILEGVAYLHSRNVAHRNIAPENIVRDADGRYKLCEFSNAAAYDAYGENNPKRPVNGYPEFIAPELCPVENHPVAPPENYECDIWSLGAAAFSLFYGRPPFVGEDNSTIFNRICTKKVQFPDAPKMSKKMKETIEKMLSKDSKKRPSAAELVKSQVFKTNQSSADSRAEKFVVVQKEILQAVTMREA